MASSSPNRLTAFQRAVLQAFFQRERGFFLTGGVQLPGGVSAAKLRDYVDALIPRLLALAAPRDRA